MKFFKINIVFGIVGSDKCNAIVISSLKLRLKCFCKTVVYDMMWMFCISKCYFSSFNPFFLLLVTVLTTRFANDSDILFFVCGG